MSDMGYDQQRDEWFSPQLVIGEFRKLTRVFGDKINDPVFQRAREMYLGAVTLLGAYELSNENQYYLQSNNQTSSPDVMGANLTEQPNQPILLELVQLEVVELNEHHPATDVFEFLKETKLSKKKSYTDKDLIVVAINKPMPFDHKDLHKKLQTINPKSTIYVLGKPSKTDPTVFAIDYVYPFLTKPVVYNIDETMKKYSIKPRVHLKRGMNKTLTFENERKEPLDTYTVLGLDKKKVFEKFGIKEE